MEKNSKFYGEMSVGIMVESKKELERFKSMFSEDSLEVKMTIKTVDSIEHRTEVLEVFSVDWEEF